jgi:hypothetical protein
MRMRISPWGAGRKKRYNVLVDKCVRCECVEPVKRSHDGSLRRPLKWRERRWIERLNRHEALAACLPLIRIHRKEPSS